MELRSSKTFQNLLNAFAGECQAHVRYHFLAKGAKQQKLYQVEKQIKELMKNECHHAKVFYDAIQSADSGTLVNLPVNSDYPFKEKSDFIENLRFASENEKEEGEVLYPQFAKIASEEGFAEIAAIFNMAAAVELCHMKRLAELYDKVKNNTLYKSDTPVKWKCADCGFELTASTAFTVCPLCKAPQGDVMLNLSE